MAKGFNTLHVKSAVKSRNKFDLSRTHLTTMDFGQIVPLFVEETVPGDQFNIGANYFSRMAPLVKPTYGKFNFKTVSVFVPYHQIADDADAWLAGKTSWEGSTTRHRYIEVRDLANYICTYCLEPTTGGSSVDPDVADIAFTDASGAIKFRKFSAYGKYWIKILNALGYTVPEYIDLKETDAWWSTTGAQKLSAYPLLAFFKAYNDWMSQSQKFNTSELSRYLKNVRNNQATTGYGDGHLNHQGLYTLMNQVKLNYENDYFTSAWRTPNNAVGAINDTISSIGAPYSLANSGTISTDSIQYDTNGVKVVSTGSAGYSTNLAQRTLDFLRAFDDWVRRNNYSGSRAVQQIYSRFGIKTDDYKTNYAHVLGTDSTPIQVGDVTATAQDFVEEGSDKNVTVGDYAGKGILNGGTGFNFKADDYGLLMILGYFTVVPMMAYGYDRRVLRTSPLDYYNPEFDGLGAEAISFGEIFANPIANPDDQSSQDDQVFGFTERYNAYRYGRDVITGEFRNFHKDADMNTWHTGRLLNDARFDEEMVAQSDTMNTLAPVNSEYNRIFSITDGSVDHFYLTCQFSVSAVRPMLSLNQVPRLGEGDTNVPRNGNVIN